MSMGTHHDETGWLNLDRGQYLLRRDAGGTWQLELGLLTGWRARRLVGRLVRVSGTRISFNVLSSSSIVEL
jgi:hypothetical protein